MITASHPIVSLFDTSDRAMSGAADRFRTLWSEPQNSSWSVSVNERRAQLMHSLLEALVQANRDDWDGEGSAAADPLSFEYTQAFLLALPGSVPYPEISVDPDGEFSVEWDCGPRAVFSVSIGPDGTITYAGLFGARKSHGVEPFSEGIPDSVARCFRRLAGGSH